MHGPSERVCAKHHGGSHRRQRRADYHDVERRHADDNRVRSPATNAGELREEQHRDRDEPHVQAGYGEHVRQASRREAIAQRGRQLLHVCDEEGAYERRVVAEVRVDAPPDG